MIYLLLGLQNFLLYMNMQNKGGGLLTFFFFFQPDVV